MPKSLIWGSVFALAVALGAQAQTVSIEDDARISKRVDGKPAYTPKMISALVQVIKFYDFQCDTVSRVRPIIGVSATIEVTCNRHRYVYEVKYMGNRRYMVIMK